MVQPDQMALVEEDDVTSYSLPSKGPRSSYHRFPWPHMSARCVHRSGGLLMKVHGNVLILQSSFPAGNYGVAVQFAGASLRSNRSPVPKSKARPASARNRLTNSEPPGCALSILR